MRPETSRWATAPCTPKETPNRRSQRPEVSSAGIELDVVARRGAANLSMRCPVVAGFCRLFVGNTHVSCRVGRLFRWSQACRRWTVDPSRNLRRFESLHLPPRARASNRPGRHGSSGRHADFPSWRCRVCARQSAAPTSTAVRYSNAIDFHWALVSSGAQIRAPTGLGDRHAPSSQRGGQGFEPPCSAP